LAEWYAADHYENGEWKIVENFSGEKFWWRNVEALPTIVLHIAVSLHEILRIFPDD
jgi:hypothetical protein